MSFGTIPSQPAPGTKTGPSTVQRYPAGDPRRYANQGGVPPTGTGLPAPVRQPIITPPRPQPLVPPRSISGPAPQPLPTLPYGGPIAMPGGNPGGPIQVPVNGQPPAVSIGGGPAPIGMPPAQNPIQGAPIAMPGGNMNGQLPSAPVQGMPTNGMGDGKSNQFSTGLIDQLRTGHLNLGPMPQGPAQSSPIGWMQDPTTGQWNSQTPGLPSYGPGMPGQGAPLPNFGGAVGTQSPLFNTIQNR